MVRLTIRATDDTVPPVLLKMMKERLEAGISTAPERFAPQTASEISHAFGNILVPSSGS